MRSVVTTFAILLTLNPLLGFAESAQHSEKPSVTQADVIKAMVDAEAEFNEKSKPKESTPPRPLGESIETTLPKPVPGTSNQSELEELAKQVDLLKNKVIIERARLLATDSSRKTKLKGSETVFTYREGQIYEVTAAVDHVTDIKLRPGESITGTPSSGDTVRWNLSTMKSGSGEREVLHIIVKPLDENIETNLIIATDQRTYHLHLQSKDFHVPSVSWTYPEDNQIRLADIQQKRERSESVVSAENLRFAYSIDGDDEQWKPVRVFDDGSKTFIQMPKEIKASEAPVLFVLDDEDSPEVVNYRLKGSFYIVDRLFEHAELRVGTKKIGISRDTDKNFFERLFS